MKKTILSIIFFSTFIAFQLQANELGCDEVIDIKDHKGKTFLSLMTDIVKPQVDDLAQNGYLLKGARAVNQALQVVSPKVRKKALRGAGGKGRLLSLADKLEGRQATLYTLPSLISKLDRRASRYDLSTFFGLVSCGGVTLKFSEGNYAYNIHYGDGSQRKDKQTGRSFGEGPTRYADDASDKNYLRDLEEYVTKYQRNIPQFYETLIKALANNETKGFSHIEPFGQTLLTDFLAVYTAEQIRNLMDGKVSLHWDAALLEVTLLGAFHSGQDRIQLYFSDPNNNYRMVFTDQVVNQAPGGSKRTRDRKARLYDYWQFSRSTDPAHRNRSGINITKKEFRKLGKEISDHMRIFHPELTANVERHFYYKNRGRNIFKHLSEFFINSKTPQSVEDLAENLAEDVTAFLMQVKADAKKITQDIK